MLSNALRVYEYIIKIYMYKPSKKSLEYSSHQLLECGGCIAISHLHYLALKCAKYCRECHLADILWPYEHLLIGFCHIQFGSEISSCYIMTDCVLIWERVLHLSMCFHSAVADWTWCIVYHFSSVYTAWMLPALQQLVSTILLWCIVNFSSEFRVKCFWALRQSMLKLLWFINQKNFM